MLELKIQSGISNTNMWIYNLLEPYQEKGAILKHIFCFYNEFLYFISGYRESILVLGYQVNCFL